MADGVATGVAAAAAVADARAPLRFPSDFLFGVATAAYQVEGAWNEDEKGENIWDHMLHEHPELAEDRKNGDVANNSYRLYKEDVALVKSLNMDFYRFSIAWSRVLPKGDLSVVNKKGIEYYSKLIDELLANGIQPVVTMYHWDLPHELQKLGGWANRETAFYFKDYADLLFETYGDRVKWWITFNDPQVIASGYSGEYNIAPNIDKPGVGDYLSGHIVLLAHAFAYDLYSNKYGHRQKGRVGITFGTPWAIAKTDSKLDAEAQERAMQFSLGWFAHPIFSAEGDYPVVMRERVAANSAKEGLKRSRLPAFTPEEVQLLRGSADFLGLNHYTSVYAADGEEGVSPSREHDSGVVSSQDPAWPASGSCWLKVVPWGLCKLLNWIHRRYDAPPIMVTENGVSDRDGRLEDDDRVNYYKSYLAEVLKAIHSDNVNVFAYTAWSLMDNFEWQFGYMEKFGLFHVDYETPERKRTPKKSSKLLARIARTHEIPEDFP